MALDAKMFWKKSEKTYLSQVLHLKISAKENRYTPGKINMEPKNHPFRKENHLNQTIILRFQPLIFQGVPTEAARPTNGLDDWLGHFHVKAMGAPWNIRPWGVQLGPSKRHPDHAPKPPLPIQRKKPSGHTKIMQNWSLFFFAKFFTIHGCFFFGGSFFAPTLLYHSVLA